MKYSWLPKIILIFSLLVSVAASKAAVQSESVRVAVVKGVEELRIDGAGLLAADERGNPVQLDPPFNIRRISDRQFSFGGRNYRRLTVSAQDRIRINGKSYRGIFDFYPSEKGLLVVNELPIEEYLVGLINCEISSLWPIEAIKAQAVIARSYAIYQKDSRRGSLYHLESSVMDQVYDGIDIEDSRAARGVTETEGEVLVAGSSVIQAFYHSSCGGHTESAKNVWGANIDYLQGVECRYCLTAPNLRWETTLPLKKIEQQLKTAGYLTGTISDIREGEPNRSGRMQSVTIIGSRGVVTISGVNFRKAIGYGVIKSTNMVISVRGDDARFSGAGNGHGVGLCQWGSKQRAADGFNYREILASYYPGVRIEKLKY